MQNVRQNDAPAVFIMGLGFLVFGLMMVLMPARIRTNFDRFADSWKAGSWHPYKMPDWGLRVAGAVVITIASLFLYITYLALTR